MKILYIENDETLAEATQLFLVSEEMSCDVVFFADQGVSYAKIYDYDLILVSLELPSMDGYEILTSIKNAKVRTPIIVLSNLSDPKYIIKALNLGADDYLTKPFAPEELIARIRAITRRSIGHSELVIRVDKVS